MIEDRHSKHKRVRISFQAQQRFLNLIAAERGKFSDETITHLIHRLIFESIDNLAVSETDNEQKDSKIRELKKKLKGFEALKKESQTILKDAETLRRVKIICNSKKIKPLCPITNPGEFVSLEKCLSCEDFDRCKKYSPKEI